MVLRIEIPNDVLDKNPIFAKAKQDFIESAAKNNNSVTVGDYKATLRTTKMGTEWEAIVPAANKNVGTIAITAATEEKIIEALARYAASRKLSQGNIVTLVDNYFDEVVLKISS